MTTPAIAKAAEMLAQILWDHAEPTKKSRLKAEALAETAITALAKAGVLRTPGFTEQCLHWINGRDFYCQYTPEGMKMCEVADCPHKPTTPSPQEAGPTAVTECLTHTWKPRGDFELGGNRSEVICVTCGVHGERDDATGEVYWPAT